MASRLSVAARVAAVVVAATSPENYVEVMPGSGIEIASPIVAAEKSPDEPSLRGGWDKVALENMEDRFRKEQVMCSCTTPTAGTVGHNQFTCTDGTARYCARDQECYATTPFIKGLWQNGCQAAVHNAGSQYNSPLWREEEVSIQEFPVAVPAATDVLFLRIRVHWTNATLDGLCVAVVAQPADCSVSAFPEAKNCAARPLRALSDPFGFLGFEVPRPRFMMDLHSPIANHNHSVCFRRSTPLTGMSLSDDTNDQSLLEVVGKIVYYPAPSVNFTHQIKRIGVRTFLNPGWHQELWLSCSNCTVHNQIAIRPVALRKNCKALAGPTAAALAALASQVPRIDAIAPTIRLGVHGGPPCLDVEPDGPCSGYVEDSFDTGHFQGRTVETWRDGEINLEAAFLLDSTRRLSSKQRRDLFHRRSAVCFYGDASRPRGWLVGYVEFHMDGPDVQAFVGFVCFFGIALPLICMVTVLLHVNKQQRCQQHVQELRLQYQREQLERELGSNQGRGDDSRGSRSSSSRGGGALPVVSASAVVGGRGLHVIRNTQDS